MYLAINTSFYFILFPQILVLKHQYHKSTKISYGNSVETKFIKFSTIFLKKQISSRRKVQPSETNISREYFRAILSLVQNNHSPCPESMHDSKQWLAIIRTQSAVHRWPIVDRIPETVSRFEQRRRLLHLDSYFPWPQHDVQPLWFTNPTLSISY